ncbi:MAG: BREX-4 system phosphatase PglZ [Methanosarcina mazei]|nr:BREX-4 system phosphatase PglZ [Methanosarcina mazei]
MSESFYTSFNTLDDLLQMIHLKYSGRISGYKSSSRFPSTLIFFNSKISYEEFLRRIPFKKKYISEIIPEGKSKLNCYMVKRWIEEVTVESFDSPQVLLPITEYIRLCKITNDYILDEVFTGLLQTENASLIIPMLDYSHNYKDFFQDFIHRDRMAEVCYLNEKNIDDFKVIKLFLDSSGLLPEEKMFCINDTKHWIQLWESGNFSFEDKVLVKDTNLIAAISKAEITVPKIDKISIANKIDLLSKWYGIDPSVIAIEPDEKIWKYIFKKLDFFDKHSRSWEKVVISALGDISNLELKYSELWEKSLSEKKYIERWFWLNEAKKSNHLSTFIQEVVNTTEDPEMLIDKAWKIYISNPTHNTISKETLNERIKFLKSLKEPLFSSGKNELMNIFLSFVSNKEIKNKYLYISGIFDFEQEYLIQYVIEELNKSEKSKYPLLYSRIKDIWLPLSFYLEKPLTDFSEDDPCVCEDFTNYSEIYINEYIMSKLLFDEPTKKLKKLQNEYIDNFIPLLARKNNRDIPSLEDPQFLDEAISNDFIFLDGVGFEWYHLIVMLFKRKNWQILDGNARLANLPTDTKHSKVNSCYVGKHKSFDELLHKPYRYPDTIYQELLCIQKIVDEIDEKYKSREKPIIIVSDHGSTAFARKGKCPKLEGLLPDHGGRYAYYSDPRIEQKEHVYTMSDDKGKIVIPLSYVNFDSQNPKGEAHGGATPEEVLAFSIKLAPPKCEISDQESIQESIIIKSPKSQYSAFDKNISFLINSYLSKPIDNIKISVNRNPSITIDLSAICNKTILCSIDQLKEYGLEVGDNVIEFTINHMYKSKANIEFISSSKKTDFDDEFDF